MLGLLLGVEVVEVAEELVEPVHRGQELVAVAQMVLAELAGGIAQRLERLRNRDVLEAQAEVGGRQPDLGEAGAQRRLAGDEGRPPRRAALLGIVVGEHHAFLGDAVDVGRAVAHEAQRIGADVGEADIVAEDDEDVRPSARRGHRRLRLCLRRRHAAWRRKRGRGGNRGAAQQDIPAAERAVLGGRSTPGVTRTHGHAPVADDAAKSDVTGRRIDGLCVSRGRPVAPAVVGRAQMRAALQHLARDLDVGLAGVVARGLRPAPGVVGDAAGLGRVGLVAGREPVAGPLPDIADHVGEAVAVGGERADGGGARHPAAAQGLARKLTAPDVGHALAAGRELFAPGEFDAVQSAAGRKFPLGLGRQVLAGPSRIGERVGVRDMHDRVVVEPAYPGLRPLGMAPIGALHIGPPLAPVAEIDTMAPRHEDERARIQHVGQRAGVVLGVGCLLCERDVAGLVDELSELAVRDRCAVHPEAVDRDAMRGRLLGIVAVRAHAKGAGGNPHHADVRWPEGNISNLRGLHRHLFPVPRA